MAHQQDRPQNPFSDANPSSAVYSVSATSRPVSPLEDTRPSISYVTPSAHEFGQLSPPSLASPPAYDRGPTSPPIYGRGPTSPPAIVGATVSPRPQGVPGGRGSYISDEEEDEPPRRYASFGGDGTGQFGQSTDRLNIHREDTAASIRSATSRKSRFESMWLIEGIRNKLT
jgi:hypothetical protein